MRLMNGKLIVDNEDYRLPVNTLDVKEVDGHVVFRCLTEDHQLFGAVVAKEEPDDVILSVGQLVVMRAGTAPVHELTFAPLARFVEVKR